MDEKPAEAVRGKPDSSLVAACRAVGGGQGGRGCLGREHGRDARRRAARDQAAARRDAPGDRRADPRARRPRRCCSTAARTPTRAPSTCSSSPTWARSSPRRSSASRTRRCGLLSIGEEPEKGNQLTLEAHELLAAELAQLRRATPKSRDLLARAADVVVTDGFTGNVALKALEGTIRTVIEGLREEITKTALGKVGGLLIRPAARRLRAPARPRHLRRRIPARAARAGRDRARKLVPDRDRERRSASPRVASSTTSPASLRRTCLQRRIAADLCMIGAAHSSLDPTTTNER